MRFLSLLLGFLLLIVVALFTLSNTEAVSFRLFPLEGELTLVGWQWAFIIFACGFLFGLIAAFNGGRSGRVQKRQLKRDLKSTARDLKKSEAELDRLRGRSKKSDDLDPVALIGAS